MMRKYKGSPRQMVVEWIAALRSGEYEQGTRCLRDRDDKYCCLGVLSDVAVEYVVPPIKDTAWNFFECGQVYVIDGSRYSIAPWLRDHITITGLNVNKLVEMNDIDNLSFSQIADYIESKILPKIKE